jgi:pyruvate/2-oxoglutarate dehydrogenase complex dihydrolipoamide dehydrogenase (E3) component
MHVARRGADYGFSAGDITADMKRVKARKDYVVGLSNRGVERSLKSLENCRVYEGHARFTSPHTRSVATKQPRSCAHPDVREYPRPRWTANLKSPGL